MIVFINLLATNGFNKPPSVTRSVCYILLEKIMYVRSVTSGSALPAKTVKKSLWREFFFLPHILVEYEGTGLKGTINRTKWVRPSDIVY